MAQHPQVSRHARDTLVNRSENHRSTHEALDPRGSLLLTLSLPCQSGRAPTRTPTPPGLNTTTPRRGDANPPGTPNAREPRIMTCQGCHKPESPQIKSLHEQSREKVVEWIFAQCPQNVVKKSSQDMFENTNANHKPEPTFSKVLTRGQSSNGQDQQTMIACTETMATRFSPFRKHHRLRSFGILGRKWTLSRIGS